MSSPCLGDANFVYGSVSIWHSDSGFGEDPSIVINKLKTKKTAIIATKVITVPIRLYFVHQHVDGQTLLAALARWRIQFLLQPANHVGFVRRELPGFPTA
jgi:hypothetical protein